MNVIDATLPSQRHTPSSRVGRVELGCFRLMDIIGRGSYGITYRAEQLGFDRPAVVKIAHAELLESPDADLIRRRFADELRAATRVQHPNLVTMFTAGHTADGLPAIAMELVHGELLEDLLLAYPGGLPVTLLGPAFEQMASALAALHEAGVVHRDLSPRNVIFDVGSNSRPRIKILDFGVAMLSGRPRHTIGAVGTPRYMAPEQLRGQVASSSDMFSLGAILWWALTGEEYRHDLLTLEDLHALICRPESRPDPRALAPHIPARMASLVGDLLATDEDQRPTATKFLEAWSDAFAELDRSSRRRASSRPSPSSLPPPPPMDSMSQGPSTFDAPPSSRPSTSGKVARPRVLVVDSNPITRHLVVAHTQRHGCRTQVTSEPRDATRSSADEFDLIVLSQDIADADALDVARFLHEYHPEQWVVLTGHREFDEVARTSGVRAVIAVPAGFEQLTVLIDELRGDLAMRESSRPDGSSAVDRSVLDELHAHGPRVLQEAIELFVGQTPESLAHIAEHQHAGDGKAVHDECRALATSARALGALHLGRLAHAAAELVADGDLPCIPGFLAEMEREYGLVFRELMDVHTPRRGTL